MARSKQAPLYAALLDVAGVDVLVVGGGEVAARKVTALLESGARVTLVSPAFHQRFNALKKNRNLTMIARPYQPSDLQRQPLVFAATNDEALNARIAATARERGAWVNVAAPPDTGNMVVPALARRGRIRLAISTSGSSAALTRALREHLETAVGPEWDALAGLLDARRKKIQQCIKDAAQRRALLQSFAAPEWRARIVKDGARKTAQRMDAAIRAAQNAGPRGKALSRGRA